MEKKLNHSEIDLEILKNIEANPNLTQRQMAKDLGISLGKTNYLIKALLAKGQNNILYKDTAPGVQVGIIRTDRRGK